MKRLTVLSLGGGQDSTAILYKLGHDAEFRRQYAPERLLVIMSDTGDEHPETYEHVHFLKQWCATYEIEFTHLTAAMGYHLDKWPNLRSFYRRTSTIGSKCYPKSCTDKLKIQPFYRYLESWLGREYRVTVGRKRGLYEFAKRYDKIHVLLGIAADELGRQAKGGPKWMQENIIRIYPLIDLGWTRKECQEYIASLGYQVPVPSNCMLCPFKSEIEVLWLARNHPDDFREWVALEQAKLTKWAHLEAKNYGVFGKTPLSEVLNKAEATYATWTDKQLDSYRMSHGHCVKSSY